MIFAGNKFYQDAALWDLHGTGGMYYVILF
jgi:hypothetical protein